MNPVLKPRWLTSALVLLLAGCASTGGLHPVGTERTLASVSGQRHWADVPVSPAGWPTQDWWTGLHDPQLNALISEALAHNPSLEEAQARVAAAQAQVMGAQANREPSLTGGASVAGAHLPSTVLPASAGGGHYANMKYADLDFKWTLDLWGGQRAAWEAAVGRAHAADVDLQAARVDLSVSVARAYVQLSQAHAERDVSQAELDRATQARTLTQQRLAAGLDNQIQAHQADSEVASAQAALAQANRDVDAARLSLAALLGAGPDRALALTRPAPLAPQAWQVPADLSVDLIGHRADLVAARWRVEASRKDIKEAQTEFLPNVSLGALAGLVNLGGGNLFTSAARFYQVGPSLSLPIFDGGRLRANLAGKDAATDLAIAQYNQTLVTAMHQVADGLSAQAASHEQVQAQTQARDAAQAAWTLAEQRYRAGVGSYLDALSVRQQLLVAERRLAELQAQQVDQSIQVIAALGGGFQPQSSSVSP